MQSNGTSDYVASWAGAQFNVAYRSALLLLKVPWLPIELISVMELP